MWNDKNGVFMYAAIPGKSVEVYERMSNFIPHFIVGVITYPCWYLS